MARITDEDRVREFENIKDILDKLEIAAEILRAGPDLEESCLLISLPTNVEEWREEYKEDLHLASGNLFQLGDEEEQQTKYLMLYMPIQVDLTGVDELAVLQFANGVNETMTVGTCFYGQDKKSDRMLLQVKWICGGYVGEFMDEGVICEAVYELGYAYDRLKEQLLTLVKQTKQ